MEERRRYHRLNIQLPVSYADPNSQKNISIATVLDVSATGICLLAKERLKAGQALPIQVTLPDEVKITINIKVIWVREVFTTAVPEYKMGVKLLEPIKADEKKFVKFYAGKFLEFFSKEKVT